MEESMDSISMKSEVIIEAQKQEDGSNPEMFNMDDPGEGMDDPGEDSEEWIVPEIGTTKRTTTSFLDPSNWRRTTLSEEEAVERFFRRAQTPKYINARFKCGSCFTNFARQEKLEQHLRVNHDEDQGTHVCPLCKRRFQKPCKLRMHVKKHYLVIQCLRCDASFNGEGLAFQHEEFHRGVSFNCKFCDQEFRHKSTYYQHVRTRHRSSHVCAECGASFGSPAGLNVHKKRRHYQQDTPGPQDHIYCKRCDIKFSSVEAFHEHYRHSVMHADDNDNDNETSNSMKGCGVTLNDSNFKKQQRSRHPMQCDICKRTFASFYSCMKHHRAVHSSTPLPEVPVLVDHPDDKRVHCDVCGVYIKDCARAAKRVAHTKCIGRWKKGGYYRKETSMYTHMNAHTRNKMYRCEVCGMQFPYPTSLNRHKVTHTGEKKYPCPLCDKRFTQRNSMTLHYRTYHLKEPYPKRNRSKKKKIENDQTITIKILGS